MKAYTFALLLNVTFTHVMDLPTLFMVSSDILNDCDEPMVWPVPKKNYIDRLLPELHGKIVKNIFNLFLRENDDSDEVREIINKCFGQVMHREHIDQKKLEQHVLRTPILLGMKFAQEFSQLQQLCCEKIGGKEFTPQQLFVLPRQERDVFLRLANPSLFHEGNIWADDFKVVAQMTNRHIKKGLQLYVNHLNPTLNRIRNVSGCGIVVGSMYVFIAMNIPDLYEAYWFPMIGWYGCWGILGLCQFLIYRKHGPGGYLKTVKL